MPAVLIRLRAELRSGWRGILALTLIAGVFGGAVLGALAAGRRTATVVERLETVAHDPQVFVPMFEDGPIAPVDPTLVRSIEQTEAAIEVREVRVAGDVGVVASLDPRLGTTYARGNLLEGRRADPAAADEVVLNPLAAERLRAGPGDRIEVAFAPPGVSSEVGGFAFAPEEPGAGGEPIRVALRVTGVVVGVGDLVAASEPHAMATPAFLRAHPDFGTDSFMMVWLKGGDADLPAFRQGLSERSDGQAVFVIEARIDRAQVARSFHLQAVSMWLLAAAVAFATLLVFGQTLARHIFMESGEYPTLAALGFSRWQLFAIGFGRAGLAAAGGALIAGVLAFASSALTPFGAAKVAEPDRGLRFDAVTFAGGAAAIGVAVLFVAVIPAIRAASRRSLNDRARSAPGVSRLASLLARAFRRPGPAVGSRMALETGGGSTSVPVRSTLGGIAFGLAAFVAALTVASSMTHLERTPRLYGWGWDAQAGGEENDVREDISDVPGLEAIAVGSEFVPLQVGGIPVVGMSMEAIRGSVGPTVLDGRPPSNVGEIAIGRTIARRLGVAVGDDVQVQVQGAGSSREMRLSGIAVFPRVDDSVSVGEGAFITLDAMYALYPPAPPPTNAFVRFAPGMRAQALAALRATYGDDNVDLAEPPSSVLDFGRVSGMPTILASVLGALAAGTLAHGLTTTVRRRRRDLAILKCLGFVRGQVRSAVAWNATILVALALLIAIPAGIAGGRWLWTVIASGAGFVVEPLAPWRAATAAIPAALVLANLVASLPARSAARTQPSVVLRSE